MSKSARIIYVLLFVAAIVALFLLWGCSASYEAREEAFMEAVEEARDRPCVPEYVYDAHRKVWEAATTDSLQERTAAFVDQELNHLEQSCGYLQR